MNQPHISYQLHNKLNWIEHIGYVKNKVAKGIGIICKARKFLTKKVLLTLYNTFIFPYLIYCVEIGGCAKKTHLASLYILQKRIVRTTTFADKLAHTGPIFSSFFFFRKNYLLLSYATSVRPSVRPSVCGNNFFSR